MDEGRVREVRRKRSRHEGEGTVAEKIKVLIVFKKEINGKNTRRPKSDS